ncbi:Catenin-beta-like protein [Pseudoneurospora amorphoporcata]|uniref:Catenin-beta-like protein n=1 Tax=Pseudoneurospora amorphoporcata TaxID=241081 RepID=A0AAN6SBJ8_9PEZI|nr:Catenin-beta-like protein [Pseudoneurospora amorphoporcata]
MNVDELFKNAGVPSKRKLDPVRDPNEIYKSAKLSTNGSRHAQVEDEEDTEAGPAPLAEDAEDYGDYSPSAPPIEDDGDDEEGRFFGGGITTQEKEILDFMDRNTTNPADDLLTTDKIDLTWLKKTALNFEKRITRNAELRARHEDDPSKFIDSEADLDASIKALSILSEHPDLYADFARLGCVSSLVSLLAHENTDIAIDAVEIINELTDEDVAASDEQFSALTDSLLEADLLGLLVSNFSRLDEQHEADRTGVYHALSIIENLCSRRETADQIGKHVELLEWLLSRAKKSEAPTVSQNKQYAAEILAILVQSSPANRRRLASDELNAVDTLLTLIAPYRRRDPERGSFEEEYMENLFECLTCLVDEHIGKTKFVEAEGVELCLLILSSSDVKGKLSKPACLRLLDHAASFSSEVCLKIVEAGGLKTLFTLFMSGDKSDKDKKKGKGTTTISKQDTEHLLGIFASMLRHLPAASPGATDETTGAERIRLLAKFVEKDYAKTSKLIRLRRDYSARVNQVDQAIKAEAASSPEDFDEDDAFSRRLDAGLFCLQTIDVILAWLIAEDTGCRAKIRELLKDRDEGFEVLAKTLREQRDGVDGETEEGRDTGEMLKALLEFLE